MSEVMGVPQSSIPYDHKECISNLWMASFLFNDHLKCLSSNLDNSPKYLFNNFLLSSMWGSSCEPLVQSVVLSSTLPHIQESEHY